MPVLHEVMTCDLRDIWEILLHSKDSMGSVGDKITLTDLLKEKECNGEGYIPSSPGNSSSVVRANFKNVSQKRVMSSVNHYCR